MSLVSSKTAVLKQNYHHTFELRKDNKVVARHTLLLNPQNLSQTEQARVNVTQTLGGSYVTDFGAGLPTVTISGTTGYRSRYNADRERRDGYEEFVHFRNEIYRKFIQTNDPSYQLFWYNWEDEEYWNIQPTNFILQRSVSEPLLYRYTFNFTCLMTADKAYPKAISLISGENRSLSDFVAMASKLSTAVNNIAQALGKFL